MVDQISRKYPDREITTQKGLRPIYLFDLWPIDRLPECGSEWIIFYQMLQYMKNVCFKYNELLKKAFFIYYLIVICRKSRKPNSAHLF